MERVNGWMQHAQNSTNTLVEQKVKSENWQTAQQAATVGLWFAGWTATVGTISAATLPDSGLGGLVSIMALNAISLPVTLLFATKKAGIVLENPGHLLTKSAIGAALGTVTWRLFSAAPDGSNVLFTGLVLSISAYLVKNSLARPAPESSSAVPAPESSSSVAVGAINLTNIAFGAIESLWNSATKKTQ